MTDELKHQIGKVLGRVPSGVFVVTSAHAGLTAAMLASWVQQASFDPPAVSLALAKDRPLLDLVRSSGKLAISIVPEGDKSLMKRYARGIKDGEDPFAGLPTLPTPGGLVVLADALGWMEAEVIGGCGFNADHELIIAKITAAAPLRDGLAFAHQRGNGFHY